MKVLPLLAVVAIAMVVVSCSTGPTPPQPGTPAFFWNAARETYRGGDFVKADDDLSEIVQTENEFTAKARVWHMVLSAGLSQGFAELATGYEAGGRANRANPGPFRGQANTLRTSAGRAALDFTQAAHDFAAKDQSADVLLAFDFPAGSVAEPGSLNKIAAGMLMLEAEAAALQNAMVQRGTLKALCAVAGSPDDSAKVLDKFKAGEVRIPRATFLSGMAKLLYDDSDVFTSNKLDQPQRLQVMLEESLAALRAVPETKDTKELSTKVQTALKKMKKGSGGI